MATKASVLLCSFLFAILLIPSLTSARELLQIPQVHTVGGEGNAEDTGHDNKIGRGALNPNVPVIGGGRGQPYTRGKPYLRPSPPYKPLTHRASDPNKPVISVPPGRPYSHGKPYHQPSPPHNPTP